MNFEEEKQNQYTEEDLLEILDQGVNEIRQLLRDAEGQNFGNFVKESEELRIKILQKFTSFLDKGFLDEALGLMYLFDLSEDSDFLRVGSASLDSYFKRGDLKYIENMREIFNIPLDTIKQKAEKFFRQYLDDTNFVMAYTIYEYDLMEKDEELLKILKEHRDRLKAENKKYLLETLDNAFGFLLEED